MELENIPVEDTHWQAALALAEKLGLESLPDEKKNSPGLFITDETLDSVCLIYKAPDDEILCCSGNGCIMWLLFEFYLSTDIDNINVSPETTASPDYLCRSVNRLKKRRARRCQSLCARRFFFVHFPAFRTPF